MNDMRELLSGALPAPQDEPQQRDVIDAAMDWGTRRRRRDWALSGAAALAVVAVGAGIAAMSGGSGKDVNATSGPQPSSTHRSIGGVPSRPLGSPACSPVSGLAKNQSDYCRLFSELQHFGPDFAKGSVKYIQADLPSGFTVKAPDSPNSYVLILTGPDGKTNYLFPSTEPASTLDHPLSCGTPAPPGCVQTSTEGGTVVVNGGPSGDPSGGYVKAGLQDPRVDILVGTSVTGALNGMAPPTAATSLLSNTQIAKILGDPALLAYAKAQLQHQQDLSHQLETMVPPSTSGSSYSSPPAVPSSGATDSFPPPRTQSSGNPSWSSSSSS